MKKTKAEKREELSRKKEAKIKKGGTFSGQILRSKVNKNYAGKKK